MSEITEIQDMVFSSMRIKAAPTGATAYTLLDYFLPRQYIQLYPQNLVVYALRDIGVHLIKFASLVDIQHPDIANACDGQFNPTSEFGTDILEILEAGKALSAAKRGDFIPSVLSSFLNKKHLKVVNYISEPTNYIRLVSEPLGRANLRVFESKNFALSLNKPHIWRKLPGTFKPYTRRGPGEHYGFRRMTMTNAAIILSKMANRSSRMGHIFTFVPSISSNAPTRIVNFVDALEKLPDAGGKPIFDKYWVVEIGSLRALLGEIDRKSYFIICWD